MHITDTDPTAGAHAKITNNKNTRLSLKLFKELSIIREETKLTRLALYHTAIKTHAHLH